MKNIYGFLVKTDKYAGNFEREMYAYMTGCIGECQVGNEYLDDDLAEKFPNILQIADEYGCFRPVAILAADEKFYVDVSSEELINSLVIYFDAELTSEQINILKVRAKEFAKMNNLHISEFEYLESTIITKRTNI